MKLLARMAIVQKRIISNGTTDFRADSTLFFKWKTIRSITSNGRKARANINNITMRQYKISPL